jgi:hypothetical protein
MGHGAVRVGLQRFLEAGNSLLMVVAKAPLETTVEPTLGVRGGGGHLPGVGAEIIWIVHVASAPISDEVDRGRQIIADNRPDASLLLINATKGAG